MFSYIKGKIVSCSPTLVTIEYNNSIGFDIEISVNTYETIKNEQNVLLFLHSYFKNEGQSLNAVIFYGFATIEEKKIFELLISVSGIGSNTARVMLSSLSPSEMINAISSENESKFSAVKGIGPKTAKRLILELKDKVLKNNISTIDLNISNNNFKDEALIALTALGFNRNSIIKAFNVVDKNNSKIESIEDYIKFALKVL